MTAEIAIKSPACVVQTQAVDFVREVAVMASDDARAGVDCGGSEDGVGNGRAKAGVLGRMALNTALIVGVLLWPPGLENA